MATTLQASNQEYIPKTMEDVTCPMCGDNKYRLHKYFGHKNQYRYVECKSCTNIYVNPRPLYDSEFTDIAYDQYGMDNAFVISKGEITAKERANIDRFKITLRQMEKQLGKKGKVLEIGCGTGEFLVAAKECGWEPFGIDISGPMINHIQENLGILAKAGQFHELDINEWGDFDVIFASHVIEHIPNPNQWMERFKSILRPNGLLCLNIPNQHAPEKKLQRFLLKIKLRNPKWSVWRTPDHLYEPHIKSIKYLLSKHSFKIKHLQTYSKREKEKYSFGEFLFHKLLKWGSKIRVYATL